MKIIELHKSITASNEKDADALRWEMKFQGNVTHQPNEFSRLW